MILYFMDRSGTVIGHASTNLDQGYYVIDDSKMESVANGIPTLDATIAFDIDSRSLVEEYTKPGNYVLRYQEDEIDTDSTPGAKAYTIRGFEDFFCIVENTTNTTARTVNFYAEGGGLDLLNDLAPTHSGSTPRTLEYYANRALRNTNFRLRDCIETDPLLIDYSNASDTVVARLRSLMAYFEAEVIFGFTLQGLQIVDRWIDFVKKRGKDTGKVLMINRQINDITITRSIANLATAVYPFIKLGDDTELNLASKNVTGDDLYSPLGDPVLYSSKAYSEWARYGFHGDMLRSYESTTATNVDELLEEATNYIKKIREPEANYEVDISILPNDVNIGDRINIVDDYGEVYISGRVLELETSISGRYRKATIGDYLIKSAGLSDRVRQLAEDFKTIAESRTLYLWIAYSTSDNPSMSDISLEPTDKTYIGTLPNQIEELTNISQITSDKLSKFKWSKTEGTGADGITLKVMPDQTVFKNKTGTIEMVVKVYVGENAITTLEALRSYWPNAGIRWYRRLGSTEIEITSDSSFEHFRNNKFILSVSYDASITSVISYRAVLDTDITN